MGGFAKVDNVFGWMNCLQGGCIGLGVSMGGFLASSFCRSYEAKILQMKENSSENSPRFIFGFSRFAL